MSDSQFPAPCPIAIVGISAIAPGATDVDMFWRNVLDARDLITDVPASRWLIEDFYDPDPDAPDKTYCKRGAFLPEVDFDPLSFGVPPNNLQATDTSQLLALVAAAQVLSDVTGGRPETLDRERVSVIIGSAALELMGEMACRMNRPVLRKVLRERGISEPEAQAITASVMDHIVPFQEASFPGLLNNIVAGRIANRFDLHGTNCTVDAACASSLAALAMAMDDLTLGRSDLSITGGVDTMNGSMMFVCFSKTPALSSTGDCRPFAEDADGTVLGEGLALFALKRLADAERDGDRVYAVIRGLGSSSDGRSTSIYAPLAAGQERALRRAYAAAGYGPDTVGLVEAHGTGTSAGDAAEVAALGAVFDASGRTDRPWCALGSIKSQMGHTKAAAGALGLLKAALALHHKILPPTIKIDRPNPQLDLDTSPFYLNTSARPWLHTADHPRRASVSSFGFGGTNFHVTLEEYAPRDAKRGRNAARCLARPTELVTLSADSPHALIARCTELAARLDTKPGSRRNLTDIARQTQGDFQAKANARLAIVAADAAGLADQLGKAVALLDTRPGAACSTPSGIHYGIGDGGIGRIGFLFPGQGAQYLGMSADLTMHFGSANAVWDRAERLALGPGALSDVVFPPRAFTDAAQTEQQARLVATEWAQPAIAVHSLVLLGLLDALGVRPDCVAGHSFGELSALHAARAFDADTLVRLARRRGELMRDAATTPGAMLAVDAEYAQVAGLIAEYGITDLWIANHNAPHQVVVSGTAGAVGAFQDRLAKTGPASRRLTTATAFHSPLVAPAATTLHAYLHELTVRAPLLDVYSNAGAQIYPVEPAQVRRTVADHLVSPVRFVEMIQAMYDDRVRTFIEVGPGMTLTGLVGDILVGKPHHAIGLDRKGSHGVTALLHAVGRLAALGVPMTFDALWESHAKPTPQAAASQPSLPIAISGANYGRRYPPQGGAATLPPRNPAASAAPTQVPPKLPAVEPPRHPVSSTPAIGEDSGMSGVVQALFEVQRQTAEAHAIYLRTAEQSLAALLRADVPPDQASTAPSARVSALPAPVIHHAPVEIIPSSAASTVPEVAPPAKPVAQKLGRHDGGLHSVAPVRDLEALLLSVVADKTGYPVELLGLHMELEADLGVDSITRMQILRALRTMVPSLADADQATVTEMAKLRTLGDIAGKLREVIDARSGIAGGGDLPRGIDAPPAPALPALRLERCLTRQVTSAVVTPAGGQALGGLERGPLIITEDGRGIAEILARKLVELGVTAEVRATVPADASGVIFLGGLADVATVPEALAVQRAAFRVARVIAPRMAENGGVFVVVQDTGGRFGLSPTEPTRVWLGGLAALARTAGQEWPKASVKAIDCECGGRDASAIAEAIAAELLHGGPELDVGLAADGTRRSLRVVDAPASPGPHAELGPESVIVATGGGRGVTAAALRALARAHRPRIVILGRTPLMSEPAGLSGATTEADVIQFLAGQEDPLTRPPPSLTEIRARARRVFAVREIRATLAALEQAGSPVRYLALDVRDHAALHEALADVRTQWGPITGVLHGAGVAADQRIADKTDEQFDQVFGTKVFGLRALLAATADDPLRLLCVFSSIAGRFGFVGQCDYTMANATLEHVVAAEQARRPDCQVRALLWGPWDGGMVKPALAAHLRRAGVELIPLDTGGRAFVAELASATPDPRVMITGGPQAHQLIQVSFAS